MENINGHDESKTIINKTIEELEEELGLYFLAEKKYNQFHFSEAEESELM